MRGFFGRLGNLYTSLALMLIVAASGFYGWLLSSEARLEKVMMGYSSQPETDDQTTSRQQGKRRALAAVEGQALIEYALVIAVIAIVVIVVLVVVGQNITKIFNHVNSTMCSDTSAC